MSRRPTRRRLQSSVTVESFLARYPSREEALQDLRFFGPLPLWPEFRTPAALRALWDEFGSELAPGSRLGEMVEELERSDAGD